MRYLIPDLVLVCSSSFSGTEPEAKRQRTQTAAAAGPLQKLCLYVCEVKVVKELSAGGQAFDLVARFNGGEPQAVRIISQIFTCMKAMQLEYGMLSCYDHTYLAHRPLDSPNRLLISRAYAASATAPEVTTLAAMAWLQDTALQQIMMRGQRHPPYSAALPAPGEPLPGQSSPGHDERGAGGSSGHGDHGSARADKGGCVEVHAIGATSVDSW